MASQEVTPFQPLADRPRWQMILDLFTDQDPGTVITYEDMADHVDGFAIQRDRSAILRAGRALLDQERRAIEPVRGVGYRVVSAHDHLRMANDRRKESRRKLSKGVRLARQYRRDEVDQITADKLDHMASVLVSHERALTGHAHRIKRLEQAVVATVDRTDDRLATMQAQIDRLTSTLAPAINPTPTTEDREV